MKTTYKNYTISSCYKGDKAWDIDGCRPRNYHNHIITVRNNNTNKLTRFEFWNSISEGEIKKEDSLLFAFRCFVDDAISGSYDLDDFFAEFGYYDHAKVGIKAYKACQNQKRKAKRVIEQNLYDLLNEMSDDGIE